MCIRDSPYIALLFATVDGISKVGSYIGNGTAGHAITTKIQPRFLIIKRVDSSDNWYVLDTTRGWVSGSDKFGMLNLPDVQGDYDFANPTATGFTLSDNSTSSNGSGLKYIYYAHA